MFQRCSVPAVVVGASMVAVLGATGCDMGTCPHMGGHSSDAPAATPDGKPLTFANARCPIMGNPIDPAKVPASLIRDYKGEKVAFCCGGCPGAWDMLPASQKDAKLAAVRNGR
ncbi:MAG: hypothetical protein NTV86_06215 [Planctomycetota bacterium]|nr:hypothetical protein [Planctomycetota bacterium]